MKVVRIGVVVGVLLFQILTVKAQAEVNPSDVEHSEGNPEGHMHMANDQPEASPQETATRAQKLDADTTFPPVVRTGEEKDEKKLEAVTASAPASAENATKADGGGGGGSNSLQQNVAVVLCVASFLYFV